MEIDNIMKVQSGGRIKVRAKRVMIALAGILATIGVTVGAYGVSDVNAKTTYEDIEKFPESYKKALYTLKEAHPNWTFEVMNTGLDWNDVVYNEMNPSNRSLVPTYFDSRFVGAYYGDGWACATQTAVEYYLDPRNWLTEDYIFQFEQLTYNADTQGLVTVQKVLQNTFMSGYIQNDGVNDYEKIGLTYAQAFHDIGESIGVSPVHLATRVKQEQGTQGTSDLISGVYPGYEGYYNYYNIQASGSTHEQIVANGLNEAKSEGWNSRYAALLGGSQKVANRYILRGQDTLYLQKFDVDGRYDGRYWHQYMQNLAAPSNEGRNTKKAYASAGMLDEAFIFKIPVYNNMNYQDGFATISGKTYFYKDGSLVKGAYEIDGDWYYFDTETGEMAAGKVVTIEDKSYCYDKEGKKVIGAIGYAEGYWHFCEKETGEITLSRYAGDIFNAEDYAKYNPDVVNALGTGNDALLNHWLKYGVYEKRRPSEIYDYNYFVAVYGDNVTKYGESSEAVIGYFALYGMNQGYSASNEFNVLAYMTCNSDLYAAFGYNFNSYYEHYMNNRANENRIHTADDNTYAGYTMGTELFDPVVYAQKNKDVVNALGEGAGQLFSHWLKYGVYEGRQASIIYSGKYYLANNGDIDEAYDGNYMCALAHFYTYGMTEFRNGSEDFDVLGYATSNPDVFDAFGTNGASYYRHFCEFGRNENRDMFYMDDLDMSTIFDADYYIQNNGDIVESYPGVAGARKHFTVYGMKEGRRGNATFNVYAYKNRYKDLQDAYGDSLNFYYIHYLNFGYAEGRNGQDE